MSRQPEDTPIVGSVLVAPELEPVSVNGIEIAEAQIAQELQHHPAESLEEARTQAVRALVVRALLLQEAERLGFGQGEASGSEEGPAIASGGADPDGGKQADARREAGTNATLRAEEESIHALLDAEILLPEVDEETCRRYYEQNRERFSSEALFEAAHILIPASPEDEEVRAAARRKAEEIAHTLAAAPERFESLARECSACPSAKDGGALGQIGPGQTAPELERVLATLSPGEITSKPVATRYGFHIVRLIRKTPGRLLPFSLVRARIAEYLSTRTWAESVHQYVSLLAGRAEIRGVEIEGATTPLVQ